MIRRMTGGAGRTWDKAAEYMASAAAPEGNLIPFAAVAGTGAGAGMFYGLGDDGSTGPKSTIVGAQAALSAASLGLLANKKTRAMAGPVGAGVAVGSSIGGLVGALVSDDTIEGQALGYMAGGIVGTLAGGGLGHYSKPLGKIASTFGRKGAGPRLGLR